MVYRFHKTRVYQLKIDKIEKNSNTEFGSNVFFLLFESAPLIELER